MLTDQEFFDDFVIKMKVLSEVQNQMDVEQKMFEEKEKDKLSSKIQAK